MNSTMSATAPMPLESPQLGLRNLPSNWPWSHDRTPQHSDYLDIRRQLAELDSISLAEMDEVALMNRIDTKYVLSGTQIARMLGALRSAYRVLDVDGVRLNRYRTVYFDTSDFTLYRHHHSGKRLRYKVRSREYVDSGLSFVEVKSKAKEDRTVKERIRTSRFVTEWPDAVREMKGSRIQIDDEPMEPMVSNEFYRITLAGRGFKERLTLDLGLEFSGSGRRCGIPQVAIAEVKQDGVNRESEFVRQMRAAGIRPCGFSKYCMGVSLLYDDVKHNRFKPTLRLINELARSDYDA